MGVNDKFVLSDQKVDYLKSVRERLGQTSDEDLSESQPTNFILTDKKIGASEPEVPTDRTVSTDYDPIDSILLHEGFELNPYRLKYKTADGRVVKEDFFTGGAGHKMSPEEVAEFDYNWTDEQKREYWNKKFYEDMVNKITSLDKIKSDYNMTDLNPKQEGVLLEMIYQMGEGGVRGFDSFLKALSRGDTEEAYWQMLTRGGKGSGKSAWASQTPSRAKKLAEIIRTG